MTKARSNATAEAAKGDLRVGNGTNLSGILAVGNNGETVVADSTTSTGLRWQGSTAAGKNRIINGAMDFWQRATTYGPSANTGYYTADRWRVTLNQNQVTWSQETSIVPTGFQYSMKATAVGAVTPYFQQVIESQNCQDLAGKIVTVSVYLATSTSVSVDISLVYNTTFNADSSSAGWTNISTTSVSTTASMPNTPQTAQFTVPSNAKSLYLQIKSTSNLATTATMCLTGVQLELGSVATAFTRAGGTIQGELAACQRYYEKSYSQATAPANSATGASINKLISAYATSSGRSQTIPFAVVKRVSPTMTYFRTTNASTDGRWAYYTTSWQTSTSTSNNVASQVGFSVEMAGTYTLQGCYIVDGEWVADAEL